MRLTYTVTILTKLNVRMKRSLLFIAYYYYIHNCA